MNEETHDERFEELLPAYLDGDLTAPQREELETALAASASLRGALEQYRELERALAMRRAQVPPPERLLGWLAARSVSEEALRRHQRARGTFRLRRWLDAVLSVPSLALLGCVAAATWMLWHKDTIVSLFNRQVPASPSFAELGRTMSAAISTWAGGETWVLVCVYSAVTLTILFLTGLMTARFLRA